MSELELGNIAVSQVRRYELERIRASRSNTVCHCMKPPAHK